MAHLNTHGGSWSDPGTGAYSSSPGSTFCSDEHEGEIEFSLPEISPHRDHHHHRKAFANARRYSEQIKSVVRFDDEDYHEEDRPVDFTFKILVLGDSSVGKTCLIWRFCDNAFVEGKSFTVGLDFKQRIVELDGFRIRLLVWDTAGQERFRTLTTAYYRGAMGILLLYDVTNEPTFSHLTSWLENITQHAPYDVSKVLVGNKCDMNGTRAVPTMRAVNMASAFDLPFYETSAKVAVNVEPVFMALVKKMLDRHKHRLLGSRKISEELSQNNNSIALQKSKNKDKKQWCAC